MTVSLSLTIAAKDLFRGLLSHELIDLIKEIDADQGKWDFTLELAEHFAKLKAEHDVEAAAVAARAGHQP